MKDYDKNKESSYLQYCDVNLYGWVISPKLPVNNFEWTEDTSQFNEDFMKKYNEESDAGYFFEVDVQCLGNLPKLHNDLPFFSWKMKIQKVEKLVVNLNDKSEYFIHTGSLKQALNHGLVLKKVPRIIKFKQKTWFKSYIDMNRDLKESKK